ncbi:peptidase inhibitor family I36 protein [Streptomyces coeruleoprunus]|uniref:Peptidase inhibitor family I36 protein n=1 Tax=Streptomyces coeruleoprunus TaxID=285563 RepID=A0ABV9XIM0_9ACTN
MKKPALLAAALLLAVGSPFATAATATAADCPSGQFCAWEQADYQGQRANWTGDDDWWESYIVGPGVPSHVKVFEDASQGGDMTICLAPGQEISYNGAAGDRGDSHTWAHGC